MKSFLSVEMLFAIATFSVNSLFDVLFVFSFVHNFFLSKALQIEPHVIAYRSSAPLHSESKTVIGWGIMLFCFKWFKSNLFKFPVRRQLTAVHFVELSRVIRTLKDVFATPLLEYLQCFRLV